MSWVEGLRLGFHLGAKEGVAMVGQGEGVVHDAQLLLQRGAYHHESIDDARHRTCV